MRMEERASHHHPSLATFLAQSTWPGAKLVFNGEGMTEEGRRTEGERMEEGCIKDITIRTLRICVECSQLINIQPKKSPCKNRKIKQVLTGGWYQWEAGGYKENVKEAVLKYEDGKMRHVETVPGMGAGGIKENDGGGEFNYDIL
jgi:hypothetical protein